MSHSGRSRGNISMRCGRANLRSMLAHYGKKRDVVHTYIIMIIFVWVCKEIWQSIYANCTRLRNNKKKVVVVAIHIPERMNCRSNNKYEWILHVFLPHIYPSIVINLHNVFLNFSLPQQFAFCKIIDRCVNSLVGWKKELMVASQSGIFLSFRFYYDWIINMNCFSV